MKKSMRKILAVCLMLAMVLTAVNVPAATAKKIVVGKSIKLNKKKATIEVGKKLTLKATVKPKKATVTWASSKKKVATVNAKGKVVAKKAGKADITATITLANGKTKKATCKVTVTEAAKEDAGTTSGGSIGTGDGNNGNGTTTGNGNGTTNGGNGNTGTTVVEMTPVPAPAAKEDNASAAEISKTAQAYLYMGDANDAEIAAKSVDITAAGTCEIEVPIPETATASTKIKSFYIDTGIIASSTVYKLSDPKLYVDGVEKQPSSGNTFAFTEGHNGTWELVFANGTDAASRVISQAEVFPGGHSTYKVTFAVTEQSAEESAASRTKALRRIPLNKADGENTIEATLKITNLPSGVEYGDVYMFYQSGIHAAEEKESEKVKIEAGKDTYTLSLTGLKKTSDIRVLSFKTDLNKTKCPDAIIQIASIKINGEELVISNTPRKTSVTKGYMCDRDTTGCWEACGRNIYVWNPGSGQLDWGYEGTWENADGVSFNNISRVSFY